MTNREFLSNNPEEMRGMLSRAKDYIENTYGHHYRMIMTEEEMLDKWLDAEYKQKYGFELTVVQTIQITTIHKKQKEAVQIPESVLKSLKEALSADDVKLSKVQLFIRGE